MSNAQSLAVGFVAGIAVAGATVAIAEVRASVDTNGVLVGYTVQKAGQVVCEDPTVYIQFRGPQSYIICE
jgi:thiamine biosynthesis lipoprotein ApbE